MRKKKKKETSLGRSLLVILCWIILLTAGYKYLPKAVVAWKMQASELFDLEK